MRFRYFLVERIFLIIGLVGLSGFLHILVSSEIQSHWFGFFAAFSIFSLRIFYDPNIRRMPERLGFLGCIGFLGFLGFFPGLDFLRFLFGFFGLGGFFGFLGFRSPKQ